ncbi:MAG TPA: hydroxyphenylacetyl-CoA thioesterase PaaI [Candidatus Obscuribacterales bacterium]
MTSDIDKTLTPQEIGAALMRRDKTSKWLSIILKTIDEGGATMSMKVKSEMLNGHDMCHGGFIFTLADTAFAYACNSRNRKTLALNCVINYVVAVREGETLTASAKEVCLAGRTGVYDVSVTNESGTTVATFRGTSYGTSSPSVEG